MGVCYCCEGIYVPRPPGSVAATESVRHCRYLSDDRASAKRIKRHLAGRHNEKAKWEKLFAEKEARWVSRLGNVVLTTHVGSPPWSATLSWWWGLCTDALDDF